MTHRPSEEIWGLLERRCRVQEERTPALETPVTSTLTSVVIPEARSRTKISGASFVSLFTRLLAADAKATNCPLEEIEGKLASAFAPPVPRMFPLTRTVLLFARSLTNTFRFGPGTVFVTRFFALLTNAMKRPSVLKMCVKELPAPATLVRSVVEMGHNDPAASEKEFPNRSRAARHNEQRK